MDRTPLDAVAAPEVVDGVVSLFERQQGPSGGGIPTSVATNPVVSIVANGIAEVEDCVLLMPSFADHSGVWHEADLRDDGAGWIVVGLRIRSLSGCVPDAVATAVTTAYDSYYEAEADFWDPPDPDHDRIAETLAEPQLSFIRQLLAEHADQGVAFRQAATRHPEIIEVRSDTEVVILDCYLPDPSEGLYDLTTGERLPDPPPAREGQHNLTSAVMVLEGGVWKVSDFQGQVDYPCEHAPTERGLPSV